MSPCHQVIPVLLHGGSPEQSACPAIQVVHSHVCPRVAQVTEFRTRRGVFGAPLESLRVSRGQSAPPEGERDRESFYGALSSGFARREGLIATPEGPSGCLPLAESRGLVKKSE